MKRNFLVYFHTKVLWVLISMGGIFSSRASTVYHNAFDPGTPLTMMGASVALDRGQLKVDPVRGSHAYVVESTAAFAAPYSPILKNNPGTVTWAFNVANLDATPALNNEFFFSVGSDTLDPPGSGSAYMLIGGGFVGNRMEFIRSGPAVPPVELFEIPDGEGLGPFPLKGSFRITYEPSTDLWSVFGEVRSDYVDPTTVSRLLGSAVDSTFTGVPLSYMAFGGSNFGTDYFDNVSVSVVPEPSTIGLLVLVATPVFARRFRKGSA